MDEPPVTHAHRHAGAAELRPILIVAISPPDPIAAQARHAAHHHVPSLDGEIAAPDERGVTHLDDLSAAMQRRDTAGLAYFAFDILRLDGRDLRRCPLIERKAMLAELSRSAGCARLLYVDEGGDRLLDAVREVGAEGIVAKRRAGRYRSGPSREWLKTKVAEVGRFVVTGFRDAARGTIEAITVAEVVGGKLSPAGAVQFWVGRRLRDALVV